MNSGRMGLCASFWLLLILLASPGPLLGEGCGCWPTSELGCGCCLLPCQACPCTGDMHGSQAAVGRRVRDETDNSLSARSASADGDRLSRRADPQNRRGRVHGARAGNANANGRPHDQSPRLRRHRVAHHDDDAAGRVASSDVYGQRLVPLQEERTDVCISDATRIAHMTGADPRSGGRESQRRPRLRRCRAAAFHRRRRRPGAHAIRAAGTCGPCKVCVTCWKPVSEQVPVQYPVTRFEPECAARHRLVLRVPEEEEGTKFREET